jgi:hypothetical protein
MNQRTKRTIKRVLMKTVQPPVRACFNLVQRVAAMDDRDDQEVPTFKTTIEYLIYWHRRVVREVHSEFGHVKVPGFATARPQYCWGVMWGAYLARALGIKRISVIEFGVAGGNGLVVLEVIAEKVTKYFGIEIDVYGFDTGRGSPKPTDYRDAPNLFHEADYPMDADKLRKRLKKAELVFGYVNDTVPSFIQSGPAPVAFASFDMALYSCTSKAFKLFEADEEMLLPRIQCYMGACMGATYSDFTGDRLAISEFNAAHPMRKISPAYGLNVTVPSSEEWAGRMFLAHIFDHSLYGADDGLIKIRHNPLLV